MITLDGYSLWYPGADAPVLDQVDLEVAEGDFALVVGRTGSGKTSLLRALNGLAPRFTGGHVEGRVEVDGRSPRDAAPREMAATVGLVGQDPLATFVTDTVEEELAYGMEQLAVAPATMRRRVEDTLDLLGIAHLRHRSLRTLSGGEQQRVAIGAVLTSHPRVLVLDEPTSALDPGAAEEVLAAVLRLVHDLGVTVVAAEHRLERVIEYVDQVVVVEDGHVASGPPAPMMRDAPLAPPVVELGRLLGWDPLPLSVRDARRRARDLRQQLEGSTPPSPAPTTGEVRDGLQVSGVSVAFGDRVVVRDVSFDVAPGEVTALMGRNGAGKSSLLWAVHGAGRRTYGSVRVAGADPRDVDAAARAALITLVPQTATDLLYHSTIEAECTAADEAAGLDPGATRDLFARLATTAHDVDPRTHPRDLSEGQRLALALAVQLGARPRVLLLDEPTRGLDYAAKGQLRATLRALADERCAVVVATHDVEFVAQTASRVLVMAEGDLVADDDLAAATTSSPMLAPQVAKVLAPQPWLAVDQVAQALGQVRDD